MLVVAQVLDAIVDRVEDDGSADHSIDLHEFSTAIRRLICSDPYLYLNYQAWVIVNRMSNLL